jgi:putative (di)nucleoside polyphosphate hydrolase
VSAAAGPAPDGYRPCVGVAVFNAAGLVFIGKRVGVDGPYGWQMPQGGIDPGETPLEAARRELREETNIRSVELLAEGPRWLAYDLPPEMIRDSWRGRWRGQAQRWFAFRFTGPESEINVTRPGDGRFEAEFSAWRWVPMDDLPGLIVPFKRPVYENVVAAFGHLAGR